MDLLTTLRASTQSHHHQIESILYADKIKNKSINQSELDHLHSINYHFFKQFESSLNTNLVFKPFHMKRARLAKSDLEKTNGSTTLRETDIQLDYLDENELTGFLYVALGSTLGGQIIVKLLKENPSINHDALSFYTSAIRYSQLWPKFKKWVSENENQLNEIHVARAAMRAFETFELIYHQTKPLYEKSFNY